MEWEYKNNSGNGVIFFKKAKDKIVIEWKESGC